MAAIALAFRAVTRAIQYASEKGLMRDGDLAYAVRNSDMSIEEKCGRRFLTKRERKLAVF